MKKIRIGLLPRILVAILLGVLSGQVLSLQWVRIFATFNTVFGQFLGFMIPLIIVGLVTPAIADIGKSAGKLLVITVVIAYVDTVFSGLLAYGTGSWLFPDMIAGASEVTDVGKATAIEPYFTVSIPPILDVMAALVFAFMVGLGIAYGNCRTLKESFKEFKEIVSKTIIKAIIPLLPLYIFGIFLCMTYTGQAYRIMLVFLQIIIVIFVLHFFILIYQFCIAGALVKHNPFRLLWNMLPAYLTALGTASSAATIPVTLKCSLRNGVHEGIAGFVVPLCATIHMSGSAMKITACALTICLLHGMPHIPKFRNAPCNHDGCRPGCSRRCHYGRPCTACKRIRFRGYRSSSYDCALYCYGFVRHSLQCYRRRSHSLGGRQIFQKDDSMMVCPA